MIRDHVALAGELAGWIEQDSDFQLMAPVPFGLVCFRYQPRGVSPETADHLNRELLQRVNEGRRMAG